MALLPSTRELRTRGASTLVPLQGGIATVATGTIASMLADRPLTIRGLSVRLAVCGTAGTTTVQVHRNGVAVTGATVSIANTATDPTLATLAAAMTPVDCSPGDAISLVISAAGTDATGLTAYANIIEKE